MVSNASAGGIPVADRETSPRSLASLACAWPRSVRLPLRFVRLRFAFFGSPLRFFVVLLAPARASAPHKGRPLAGARGRETSRPFSWGRPRTKDACASRTRGAATTGRRAAVPREVHGNLGVRPAPGRARATNTRRGTVGERLRMPLSCKGTGRCFSLRTRRWLREQSRHDRPAAHGGGHSCSRSRRRGRAARSGDEEHGDP